MEFVCRIGTPDGEIVEEVRQAKDKASARRQLEQSGFHVFEIRGSGLLAKFSPLLFKGSSSKLSIRALILFNQELAALLRAGLPLLQSIEMMLERVRDPKFRAVLTAVRDKVKSGTDLSVAVAEFDEVFPALYAATLKAGERSGELEPVLRRFLRYQKLVLEARQRVTSALVYPAVLVGLSILMMSIMGIFVIPKFNAFYDDLGADLPTITKIVVGMSTFARDRWWLILLTIGGAVVMTRQTLSTHAGAVAAARWKLKIPLLGGVFHRLALAEFTRSLSTLLEGGIPLVTALDIAVDSVGNLFVREKLRPTIQDVREGKPFFGSLDETGVMPSVNVDMVRVGEATGSLDAMLGSTADFFDEEVETRMDRILTLIEPFMMVFMGAIVAVLLLSIYLPLFSIIGKANF